MKRYFKAPDIPYASYEDAGGAADVLMGYASVDHITSETKLSRTVAVFDLGHIKDVVRGRQTNLSDRRHSK